MTFDFDLSDSFDRTRNLTCDSGDTPGRCAGSWPSRGTLAAVPSVDVVDETFLAVPPETVAAAFAAPESWARHWPDLILSVYLDRGAQGLRWTVGGALVGTMEVWLEPVMDGTLLHYFLRADLPEDAPARRVRKELRRRQLDAKGVSLGLKLALEAGREPGVAPVLP
ncbi:hypothetical protein APASM_1343 [Actinosynnema pretiosum subsp. pretiosum]|nr:hypothetical protein APASM_1343 [Actinosynnema pretiosum subsp. pretiosum]